MLHYYTTLHYFVFDFIVLLCVSELQMLSAIFSIGLKILKIVCFQNYILSKNNLLVEVNNFLFLQCFHRVSGYLSCCELQTSGVTSVVSFHGKYYIIPVKK